MSSKRLENLLKAKEECLEKLKEHKGENKKFLDDIKAIAVKYKLNQTALHKWAVGQVKATVVKPKKVIKSSKDDEKNHQQALEALKAQAAAGVPKKKTIRPSVSSLPPIPKGFAPEPVTKVEVKKPVPMKKTAAIKTPEDLMNSKNDVLQGEWLDNNKDMTIWLDIFKTTNSPKLQRLMLARTTDYDIFEHALQKGHEPIRIAAIMEINKHVVKGEKLWA